MDTVLQDLRYALRQLRRSPGFTIAAVLTLALGIGANAALFTLGNAIMAQPLRGINHSDRLVWVTAMHPWGQPARMSYPDFVDYRDGLGALVELVAVGDEQFALSTGGEPERVRGQTVSGNYFSVLQTPFALGRGFATSEDRVGSPSSVVVLSYDLWQTRFSGDSAILGRSIIVNGRPLDVIGVASSGFNGPDLELPRHLWIPIALHHVAQRGFGRGLDQRGSRWLNPIGRLKPGVTREQVEPAAGTIAARIAQADSARHAGIGARVYSAKSGLPPGSEREVRPLTILSAVVTGLVLLIACANVSNLLLSRAVVRRREIGVRRALGASRGRLVGQLFTESLLLASIAGALGLLIAYFASDWLIVSEILPLQLDVRPDARVVAFTLGAVALTAIGFGLVPAFESTRGDLVRAVKDGTQGRDPRRARLQNSLVVAQIALSLVLLTTAGRFLRSMHKANTVDIGFEATSRVLGLSFDLGLQQYSDERANAFLARLTERAMGMPGVETVSYTDVAPLGNRYVSTEIVVEGRQPAAGAGGPVVQRIDVGQSIVRPAYFQTLGMRVVRGRDFTDRDDRGAPPAVILSERSARDLMPNEDPLGKRVSLRGPDGPYLTVVGIVSDVMLGGPMESKRPTVYVPQLQHPDVKELTMLVRTTTESGPLAQGLRREIRAMDSNLPLFNVHTLAEYKQLKLAPQMNGAAILGGFGALALLLASIGVYGVMSFSVIQRTKEIGIRVALGARDRDVIGLFVGRGMRLTMIGVAIGVSLSLVVSRLLQGMLFGLTTTDAATFFGVAALLAGVALIAAWIPARRAATVEPITALRYE